MNQFQEEGYKNEALSLEAKLKEQGYLPTDIVAVAYMMLKNNIDRAEEFESKSSKVTDLLSRAEDILEDL